MQAVATKLIDVTETSASKIAQQWFADVRKNPRTPSYHGIAEDLAIPQAIDFYTKFRAVFAARNPFEEAKRVYARYADESYRNGIPLHEAIYALTLMRRHIWLYAEFQALFLSAVEQQQAVESLNRTILLFDYATYVITDRYQELMKAELDRRLSALRALGMEEAFTGSKVGIMACLVVACAFLTYYYHAVMASGVIFTHLFYIPVVLAGIWWRKKGIVVSVLLGLVLIVSHLLFMRGSALTDDVIRAVMFVVVSSVVALLAEGYSRIGVFSPMAAPLAGAARKS
ncbi:MAG: hypothetical protein QM256_07995 [Pseudomonadota bacterium]|jgi:hypothetical protein|nr:hypothetical protein [Syntrophaceae bacterium]MDI9555707.1 hypothetical protein [Pseudomonadota bacterium]NLX31227.1 hypothetical protein [Deltaproteobacteria bacterium]HNU84489.1 hypothetical protein [Syntrophales bacterium]HNZ34611.1 hypothetical protein [Syntrophales bacterium]